MASVQSSGFFFDLLVFACLFFLGGISRSSFRIHILYIIISFGDTRNSCSIHQYQEGVDIT